MTQQPDLRDLADEPGNDMRSFMQRRRLADLAARAAFDRYHRGARWHERLERIALMLIGAALGLLVAWVRYECAR